MARKQGGWEDYIPAKGEARVLAELKGSYGGKMRGNRYRRGGSRFRYSKRTQRFWVPHYRGGDAVQEFADYETPLLIANINPQAGLPQEDIQVASANNLNWDQPVARLLMIQGAIPIVAHLEGSYEDWNGGLASRTIPWCRMFYWWTKIRAAGSGFVPPAAYQDPATAQRVWSISPGASGAMIDIMERKDVISWGWRTIKPVNPFNVQYAYDGTAVNFYQARANPLAAMPTGNYVPMVRIPRKGIRFAVGETLACYAVLVTYDYAGLLPAYSNTTNDPVTIVQDPDPGMSVKTMPMFRALFTK